MRKLLLFDIDGTLLTSGGAGEKALSLAVKDCFGVDDDLADVEIAGRTDSGIARQIFAKYGQEASVDNLAAFYDVYLRHLEQQLPRTRGLVLPGIVEVLESLERRDDVAVGLLTGNLSRGAELKLAHYGVWDFFEFGAFADDHHDRNELGPFARKRAGDRYGEFAPENIFVIGDTPHDVACGRAIGAQTIALATGRYSAGDLRACGADFVFEDLANIAPFIESLGLAAQTTGDLADDAFGVG